MYWTFADVLTPSGPVSAPVTGLVKGALLQAASHARPGARHVPVTTGGPLPGGAPPERQSRPAVNIARRLPQSNPPGNPPAQLSPTPCRPRRVRRCTPAKGPGLRQRPLVGSTGRLRAARPRLLITIFQCGIDGCGDRAAGEQNEAVRCLSAFVAACRAWPGLCGQLGAWPGPALSVGGGPRFTAAGVAGTPAATPGAAEVQEQQAAFGAGALA